MKSRWLARTLTVLVLVAVPAFLLPDLVRVNAPVVSAASIQRDYGNYAVMPLAPSSGGTFHRVRRSETDHSLVFAGCLVACSQTSQAHASALYTVSSYFSVIDRLKKRFQRACQLMDRPPPAV